MKTMTPKRKAVKPRQIPQFLLDRQCGCYAEEYFHEALTLERKRTERSGRSFLLMLLNISGIPENGKWEDVARKAVQALAAFTRETDIKGWYMCGSVLGVIFTEMNEIDEGSLKRKIHASFTDSFTDGQIARMTLSFHAFPRNGNGEEPESSADLMLYPDLPKQDRSRRASRVVKRIMDITGGITGILLFAPFFLVVPLCIKLTSKGPVLFRQERVGRFGKAFTFLKFRSMSVGSDPAIHREFVQNFIAGKSAQDAGDGRAEGVYKITKDPRVTPVGDVLRKTSLDELPQFFNVLKGDMSLVGPRPPIAYEIEQYDLWHRRRVMEIKPGITGLWQVTGRSSTNFDEMVRLDLQYAREWSIWLDIKILLKTPWAVLRGKGAY